MSRASRRSLVVPAVLTGLGLAMLAGAAPVAARLHLAPDGVFAPLLRHLAGAWVILALAWLAARLCDAFLYRIVSASRGAAPFPRLLNDLVRAVLFGAAVVVILLFVFEQPATGLIAMSSVIIAVVGFALRNVIGDVFSGIALGIDHPYRIGDWIETAQGSAGKVVEITWRATRLLDRNSVAIVVPNGLVASQRLINYGAGAHDYRAILRVPLESTLPVARAKRILLSGALDAARATPGLAPDVILQDYTDGAAIYAVRFRVPDPGKEAACRDAVASRVLHALHCAGQTIARTEPGIVPAPARESSPRAMLLQQIDLFRAFDDAERAALAERMRSRTFAAGDTIFRQGDDGGSLFVIGEGVLDVRIDHPDGEPVLDRMAPGEVFGEVSLLTGDPRSATITAPLGAVVHELRREDLDPILRGRPDLADALAAIMSERQARNALLAAPRALRRDPAPASREDLLVRLRALFHL